MTYLRRELVLEMHPNRFEVSTFTTLLVYLQLMFSYEASSSFSSRFTGDANRRKFPVGAAWLYAATTVAPQNVSQSNFDGI